MSGDLVFYIWFLFRLLFIALIAVYLVSGVDDLFLDLVHYVRVIFRRLFRRRVIQPLTSEQLHSVPEKPIAIMIPAWDESSVIGRMLLNTLNTADYRNFCIFVGVYPNDEATTLEVERVREIYHNVEVVVTPAPGPTNKADCLNWIYQGILVYEKENGVRFEIFLMQDSEDVVHPLSLRYCNYLIPRMHFIQLPVFPLEAPWYDFVTGVYKDEFAENHTKDLRARETLAACLPSAGVGTALSRYALDYLAKDRRNQIFDIATLTEDYALGVTLEDLPGKKIFLQQSVDRIVRKRRWLTGEEAQVRVSEPVATREFFPNTFRAAVRQKSRWILGIGLQGWSIGWSGSLGGNYCLYRDRKAVFTNIVNVLGYAVALMGLGLWIFNATHPDTWIPPLIEPGEIYAALLIAVLGIFCWRLLNRAVAVARIYGFVDGLLSVPRLFVGNVINFCATVVAIRRFIAAKITGRVPPWEKTEHAWPTEQQLRGYHRKLGDLLLEHRLVTTGQLEQALNEQERTGRKLGEILVSMGALWEEDLVFTLARQRRERAIEIDPYARPDLLPLVPKVQALRYRVFPVDLVGDTLVLATDRLDGDRVINQAELARAFGRPVEFRLTSHADIDFAIARGYEAPSPPPPPVSQRLGERLVREGRISPDQLATALRRQKRTNQRLGETLVWMNLITTEELQDVLRRL
jgi:adsorption protein B